MSYSCAFRFGLKSGLLILMFPISLFADSRSCNSSDKQCTRTNTCNAAGTCTISVSRNGSSVKIQALVRGQFVDFSSSTFCVKQSATLYWITPSDEFFTVRFSPGSVSPTPLADQQLSVTGDSDTPGAVEATAPDCYPYSVTVCDVAGAHTCGSVDPKVVVQGGGTLPKQ